MREMLRDDSDTRIGDMKKLILITEMYGAGTRQCQLSESVSVSCFSAVVER